jgi:hypothetical protein
MTQRQLHNALRILMCIDQHELVAAGIDSMREPNVWASFVANPFLWFIKAGDADADRLWAIVERRQAPVLAVGGNA